MNICFSPEECKYYNDSERDCNESQHNCVYLSCNNIDNASLCKFAGCQYEGDSCAEIDDDNPVLNTCEIKCSAD